MYFRPAPPVRDIRRILAADARRTFHGLRIAERHAADMRSRLHELELLIARGWDLFDFLGVTTPSWPPLAHPQRPPTLHAAMAQVIESRDNAWMRSRELALEIARRNLYRRRDGLPATPRDVSARACSYPHLFERGRYVIRLRRPGR